MLTLYYSPNACSMASHVALEEAGATFETKNVNIFAGEQFELEFRRINPRAKVPALSFDDGRVLLETTAILAWIGATFPDKGLLGPDTFWHARTLSICAWLSGTVHPTFKNFVRSEQVVADSALFSFVKAKARENYWEHLLEIDAMLADRQWLMGDQFSLADPYALVFYPWGRELGLPISKLSNLAAMKDRLIARPAARRALEREKSALLSL